MMPFYDHSAQQLGAKYGRSRIDKLRLIYFIREFRLSYLVTESIEA